MNILARVIAGPATNRSTYLESGKVTCQHCCSLESLFDRKTAINELKQYRQKGPAKTTQILLNFIKAQGVESCSLLDIGGGIGAIQHELLTAGASEATAVDASSAYLEAAKEEAQRQGHAGRTHYHYGNFVDLAPHIEPADIVTLDRVICCYPDMPRLVELSARKARKIYGLVYPRDSWWVKLGLAIVNFGSRLFRKPYRFFVHPTPAVDNILRQQGLKQIFHRRSFLWQMAIYSR